MNILFVGLDIGQQRRMQLAMERLGHDVIVVNPYHVVRSNRYLALWAWHTGVLMVDSLIQNFLERNIDGLGFFDVAFVDSGELISQASVEYLRTRSARVILFCRDNPFVKRDGQRWRLLRKALSSYDLFVTTRQSTADEAPARGARSTLRVNFFADEILHRPREPTPGELEKYCSPVSFVGTWFPERGAFMRTLLDLGVPLKIIGDRWHKANNYHALRPIVVEGYLSPEEYSGAVLSSRIAIAMLSKGNRDVSTSRSMEIPSLGRLMCAERTNEHLDLYTDGEEAVFWSSAEECAEICLGLLSNPERVDTIAAAGQRRAIANNNWTEPTMANILNAAIGC
ncbi:MAG: glycosyltransferase [Sphingomonas sp.]|jgi:hypothetical protein|uniref:CgeB family protein n=1 Tax=Sphingomonas sp. TaxID=28214 RepID=UPI0035619B5D